MARPLRIEFPGALYHVTARFNAQQDIFLDGEDRHLFLGVLERVVSRFHLMVHAYCLMGNHFHLVLETPEGNLSRANLALERRIYPGFQPPSRAGWTCTARRLQSNSGRAGELPAGAVPLRRAKPGTRQVDPRAGHVSLVQLPGHRRS